MNWKAKNQFSWVKLLIELRSSSYLSCSITLSFRQLLFSLLNSDTIMYEEASPGLWRKTTSLQTVFLSLSWSLRIPIILVHRFFHPTFIHFPSIMHKSFLLRFFSDHWLCSSSHIHMNGNILSSYLKGSLHPTFIKVILPRLFAGYVFLCGFLSKLFLMEVSFCLLFVLALSPFPPFEQVPLFSSFWRIERVNETKWPSR